MVVTAVLLTLLLRFGGIFGNSDPSLVFCVIFSHLVSSVSLAFLASVFFARSNVAAACGGLVYVCMFLPYTAAIWLEKLMTFELSAVMVRKC